MFIPKKTEEVNPFDLAITQALNDVQSLSPETPEYAKAMSNVKTLTQLKDQHSKKKVDPNVLVTAGANLAGILLILHYERIHVVTSKALGFVLKLR